MPWSACVPSGDFWVTHLYGHKSVPHNEEADKLAKVGAQNSIVHKVSHDFRSVEGQQQGSKSWRQVAVQITDSSNEDNVQIERTRRKHHWQRLFELPDLEPD